MADSTEITISDVAKAAGVSVSTVSRILNNKQDVAQATRERVLEVIAALGYAPHIQAQRLRAGKTRNLALLFPLKYPSNTPFNPLDMDFIVGAAAAAGDQQFFFNLLTMPVNEVSLLNLYRSAQVDGVVLMQIHADDWRVNLLRQHNYPFVMIGHCADNTGLTFIDLDFSGAISAAFAHLVNSGHSRIGFIGLPLDLRESGYGPAARSWEGYQEALATYGLARLDRSAEFDSQSVYEATISLLDEFPDLTAIVTPHAYNSLNILQALNQRNLRVPDDCAVITITAERIAQLSSPPLTHINFPAYTMGYQAVEMLIRLLEGAEPEQILILPQLVIRSSTL